MIAFVILHYQAITETIGCVDSILKNVDDEKIIIIVDNKSPNNSGDLLKKIYNNKNNIIVIQSESNLGFAKGNNLGYARAKEYNPEYIVVLNSDTEIKEKNFSFEVKKAYKEYNFDVLGPDILSIKKNYHQNPQRYNNYTYNELKRMFYILWVKNNFKCLLKLKYFFAKKIKTLSEEQKKFDDHIRIGIVLHGAFYVYSKKYIEKHDRCFYNNTFMHFESYILHHLGMKEDLIFLYYPRIKILHYEDVSTEYCYGDSYKKSVFINKCIFDSCNEFLKIYNDEKIRIG